MKRREFIGLSAYIAATLSVPFLQSCSTGNPDAVLGEPALLLHMLNAKSITETGQAYLKQFPAENTKDKLRELLLDKNSPAASGDSNLLHSYFDKKTVSDFAAGQTVIVNGWVLSQTEARQCALYSILHSN